MIILHVSWKRIFSCSQWPRRLSEKAWSSPRATRLPGSMDPAPARLLAPTEPLSPWWPPGPNQKTAPYLSAKYNVMVPGCISIHFLVNEPPSLLALYSNNNIIYLSWNLKKTGYLLTTIGHPCEAYVLQNSATCALCVRGNKVKLLSQQQQKVSRTTYFSTNCPRKDCNEVN